MENYLQLQEDKINYLKGLIRLAKCNGVVEQSEIGYFTVVAQGMELQEEDISSITKLFTEEGDIDVHFSNKYTATLFIQEAYQLCMIDGDLDEIEVNEINTLGKEIGLQENEIEQISEWVQEGIAWRQRGESLIASIGGGID